MNFSQHQRPAAQQTAALKKGQPFKPQPPRFDPIAYAAALEVLG